jgi:hypothetical protein
MAKKVAKMVHPNGRNPVAGAVWTVFCVMSFAGLRVGMNRAAGHIQEQIPLMQPKGRQNIEMPAGNLERCKGLHTIWFEQLALKMLACQGAWTHTAPNMSNVGT